MDYSQTSSLGINPSLPSNGTPMPAPSCASDSPAYASSKGMSAPWTSQETWLASMRSALDSLVRTSAQPGKVPVSMAKGRASTKKSCVQLTLFDLPGCSLKTAPASEPAEGTSSSGTSWREDIPGATDALERLTLALPINGTDGCALRGVPTPTVCGNYNRKGASKSSGDGLATWVRMWPTPLASDWKSHSPAKQATNSRPLRGQVGASDGGPLNPEWVEWLMAWPIGHTELSASGTAKFRYKSRRRGSCSAVRESND